MTGTPSGGPEPRSAEDAAGDELVTAENYPTFLHAEIGKARLESEGVESEIFDGDSTRILLHLTDALGGIKLKVRRRDLARARAVLTEITDVPEDIVSAQEEIHEGEAFCAECHSKDLERTPAPTGGNRLVAALKGAVGYHGEAFKCRACGNSWRR